MKDFLKYTAATVAGLIVFSVLTCVIGLMCIVGMIASGSSAKNVSDNTVLVVRLSGVLDERAELGGSALVENERHLLQEIDALVRTSPTSVSKPTPLEEADTVLDIFDNTLFDVVPLVYRRFDDWVMGDLAGSVAPHAVRHHKERRA